MSRLGENFIITAFVLSLSTNIFAETISPQSTPTPLAKGTIVVAGPANTDEFYIIAENDEPKLKEILAEKTNPPEIDNVAPQQVQVQAKIAEPVQVQVAPRSQGQLAAKQALVKSNNISLPKKIMAAKKTKTLKTKTLATTTKKGTVVKKDMQTARINLKHKPSKMEIALNNALEKAINKKQLVVLNHSAQSKIKPKVDKIKAVVKKSPANKLEKKVAAKKAVVGVKAKLAVKKPVVKIKTKLVTQKPAQVLVRK